MQHVAVLGSTGSIGTSCLDVVAAHPDRLQAVGLVAHRKWEVLAEQARRFRPRWAVVSDESLRSSIPAGAFGATELLFGEAAIDRIASDPGVEVVVAGIVGAAGLRSTWTALEAGKRVAFANKETLVVAGPLMTSLAQRTGGSLFPVDSEHSAVYQSLQAGKHAEVRRIVLTASGGPFRGYTLERMREVTPEMAMAHPTWAMGPKVTVDSATMMNKALEMIEAKWLFGLDADQIAVMIHPQSIVHSCVEFVDGSVVAQLSPPDMKLPIQYALTWPERWEGISPRFDWTSPLRLDFAPPDPEAFPALKLGAEVARRGGTSGAVLNAANEVAVERFLARDLRFTEIPQLCRSLLDVHNFEPSPSLTESPADGPLDTGRSPPLETTREVTVVNVLLFAHAVPAVLPVLASFSVDALVSKAGSVLLVAIGIGLVIFFHELGHFAVAKWCDVFVERFSIGFGPILWSRKYGETEYALSVIPFGGYVKMLGQDDLDPSQLTSEELAKDPRSYMAKPVGQRMAIISAGVTMNVITGVMFYAIAFGYGIEQLPARVGSVLPGFPAWQARLQPGDRLTRIAGRPTRTFDDINRAIALSSGPIDVAGVHADEKPFEVELVPNMADGHRMIGVTPALSLNVLKTKDANEKAADLGSPAAEANPGFEQGDRVVGIDGHTVSDFSELQKTLIDNRAKPVVFQVEREGSERPVDIRVAPQRFREMGMTMDIGKVTGIVKDSPADKNGIKEGDKIIRLNTRVVGKDIDPLRLPDELAALAGQEVTLEVQREMPQGDPKKVDVRLVPANKPGWVEAPRMADTPMSAPAIGVAYNVIPTVLSVQPGSPADKAGVKNGDRIKSAELLVPAELTKDRFGKDKIEVDFAAEKGSQKSGTWPYFVYLTQLTPDFRVKLTFTNKDHDPIELVPAVDPKADWYLPGMRGLRLMQETIMLKSSGVLDAAMMGITHTKNSIIDLYLTLRNLFTRQLSYENLHGPLGIISVAYSFAQQGIPEVCLFLGILSANLAVLNFLPIPVLDGGHMVFLIWEAVTRKRPSERVQIAATYFGMAFVLCLAILVFYLDIFVHKVIG